jgi:hypothetical protein
MKKLFIALVTIAYITPCFALSIIDEPRREYSTNKKFFVSINPDRSKKKIYKSSWILTPFWSFDYETAYGGSVYVTDDGLSVICIGLWTTDAEAKNQPAILVFRKGGKMIFISHEDISIPRKLKPSEMVGGYDESTRIWLESKKVTSKGIELVTAGNRKILISLADGKITVEQGAAANP